MAFNITNKTALNDPILNALEEVYDDAIADSAAAAAIANKAAETVVVDSTLTSETDAGGAIDDALGAGRTTESIKGNADDIAENAAMIGGLYPITFVGADASSAAANSAIASKPSHITPAAGDSIAFVQGRVTATGAAVAAPALVAADTSDGLVINLVDDTTIKARFGKDSGVDYSANTYTAWVLPAVS